MKFVEKYGKAWGWEEDDGTFLATVLANSFSMGECPWLLIRYNRSAEVKHHVGPIGVCMEDRIVASIMEGSCMFIVDYEERYKPDFSKWVAMIDNPTDEVERLLNDFLEGQDDAYTSDGLLQCWLFGEVVYG